ncbi:hypothetical protein [Aminobacter sp. AP02]|uniref:hypothetical protein n=1 Tax=Aminobacter sp. AP02 TaxID=2135737 RepID=UPI000D79C64E|nr:hypothetical protein [Aminobacter sp. AP02]PWK76211.1 hypothetical protein C8K44_102198 [Aminobacter sp. AP02]
MQLLPHGNLGRGIVAANAQGGIHVPCAGVGRVLLALCIVVVLGLLMDATATRPVGKSATPVIDFPTQQGREE